MSPIGRKRSRVFSAGVFGGSRQIKFLLLAAVVTSALGTLILTRIPFEPESLGAGQGLNPGNRTHGRGRSSTQEILQKLLEALEQQRESHKQAEGRQLRQSELMLKALEDFKYLVSEAQAKAAVSTRDALEELRLRLEASAKGAAEQHRSTLEDHIAVLRRIHSSVLQAEASIGHKEEGATGAKNMTLMTVTDGSPGRWGQRTFRKHGSYGFVLYSAYRISRSRFAALGLAARAGQSSRRLEWCEWRGRNGSVTTGRLSASYDLEHHNYLYQFVLLNCDLMEPVSKSGGHLVARIDSEIVPLLNEGTSQPLIDPSNGPFLFELAVCGPPMFGALVPRAVIEFVEYHHAYVGADHFVFYDAGGVTPPVLSAVGQYLEQGIVTVTDFREATVWDVWSWAQSLAMHDCTYRLRSLARWVLMQDLDEYMEIMPPNTVKAILKTNANRSWITTGCIVFSIHHCLPETAEAPPQDGDGVPLQDKSGGFLVSRMPFRWPHVYCQAEKIADRTMCTGQLGHRKFFINPRKVKVLEIHSVVAPNTDGINLSTSMARQMHFQGLAKGEQEICEKGVPDTWWYHYDRVSRIANAVRRCERHPQTKLCNREGMDVGVSDLLSVERWRKNGTPER